MNDMVPTGAPGDVRRFGGRLRRKYVLAFLLVVVPILTGYGAIDIWRFYQNQTSALLDIQRERADSAAIRISQFVDAIESQIGWTIQIPWSAGEPEHHRLDGVRLLRQVPAITALQILGDDGREQLSVSRIDTDQIGSGQDMSATPKFLEAVRDGRHFGQVWFRRESEPYMTISVAGKRRELVVAAADVNLKFVREVVEQISIGKGGHAYAIERGGNLIAHRDIGLVLRRTDMTALPHVKAALAEDPTQAAPHATDAVDLTGKPVIASFARVPSTGWLVVVETPMAEAYEPIYTSIKISGALLLLGLAVSLAAACLLSRRMLDPVSRLQEGVARLGAGELGTTVNVTTGDELQQLAEDFNRMSGELVEARSRSERLARFRSFLTPQLADLLESSGGEALLESRRRELTVVFCDLRGFTAFAESAEPEDVMTVMREYHRALGEIIGRHQGTLERFVGDGLMVLFNAPLPCADPCLKAVAMAMEMRSTIAELSAKWRRTGYDLGFGIGIAHGYTTVGQIGFEGRYDYSAIGSVPNLAARLCAEAADGQIFCDARVAGAIEAQFELEPSGDRVLKGFRSPVRVANVVGIRV